MESIGQWNGRFLCSERLLKRVRVCILLEPYSRTLSLQQRFHIDATSCMRVGKVVSRYTVPVNMFEV